MIIWVASYPISGNTYALEVLAHYFDITPLQYYTDREDWYLPADEITPEIKADAQLYFVKTHDLPPDRSPAIYIVRDGRDALVSYAHYRNWEDAALPEPTPVDFYVRLRELLLYGDHYGGWGRNVQTWTTRRAPTAVIRFEQLITEPLPTLMRALEQLDLTLTPVAAGHAPTFADLMHKNPGIFQRGRVNQWIDEMPLDLQLLFWHHYGEIATHFGYEQYPPAMRPPTVDEIAASFSNFFTLIDEQAAEIDELRQTAQRQSKRIQRLTHASDERSKLIQQLQAKLHPDDDDPRGAQIERLTRALEERGELIRKLQAKLNPEDGSGQAAQIERLTRALEERGELIRQLNARLNPEDGNSQTAQIERLTRALEERGELIRQLNAKLNPEDGNSQAAKVERMTRALEERSALIQQLSVRLHRVGQSDRRTEQIEKLARAAEERSELIHQLSAKLQSAGSEDRRTEQIERLARAAEERGELIRQLNARLQSALDEPHAVEDE